MKKIILLCLVVLIGRSAIGQQISLHFDFENAKQTLYLLEKGNISEEEMQAFLALPGTNAIIKKVKSSADTARSALLKASRQQPLTRNEAFFFQYDHIYRDRDSLKKFVSELNNKKDSIEKVLSKKLGVFIPSGKCLDVTVYGLMGSFSGGWTFGNEPNAFYMGMHFKPYDVAGTIVTCEHELFHNIQSLLYEKVNESYKKIDSVSAGLGAAWYLSFFLFREGTAEYIADVEKVAKVSASAKKSHEHITVNESRGNDAYFLFEKMSLDLASNKTIDDESFQPVYNILFGWDWNNPGYFIGKKMTKALIDAYGDEYLRKALAKDPAYFIYDYLQLSKKEKNLYKFSAAFQEIIAEMIRIVESKTTK